LSAIITTRNNPEGVRRLVNVLIQTTCIDEIIILDSSSIKSYEKLSKCICNIRNKNIKIIRFPPLGFSEIYEYLGLSISKNNLIFYMEDDESISQNYLITLCKFLHKYYPKFNVFLVKRVENYLVDHMMLLRVFDKRYVYAPGIIHWHFITEMKPISIPVIIKHQSEITFMKRLKETLKRYALIESYQSGYKVYKILHSNISGRCQYKVDGMPLPFIPKTILRLLIFFHELSSYILGALWSYMMLVLIIFSVYSVLQIIREIHVHKNLKEILIILTEGIVYLLFTILYTLKSPYEHIKVWYLTIINDGFSNLVWKAHSNVNNYLDYENSTKNFLNIINTFLRQEVDKNEMFFKFKNICK
jgi:hypothetical protein